MPPAEATTDPAKNTKEPASTAMAPDPSATEPIEPTTAAAGDLPAAAAPSDDTGRPKRGRPRKAAGSKPQPVELVLSVSGRSRQTTGRPTCSTAAGRS
jgi:hypothetical protein